MSKFNANATIPGYKSNLPPFERFRLKAVATLLRFNFAMRNDGIRDIKYQQRCCHAKKYLKNR